MIHCNNNTYISVRKLLSRENKSPNFGNEKVNC